MINLEGKNVLVTGGSRGIGAATAIALDNAGARVVMTYRANAAKAEQVAAQCRNSPVVLHADLGEPDVGSELVARAVDAVGHLNAVVNNAGIAPEADIDATDADWHDAWQTTMQVNVLSLADICRKSIIHFQQRDGGAIVNIASRAAIRGDDPNLMHYAASKGAVVALTRSIARGFGGDGIVAYSIAPGWVATDMAENFFAANPNALDSFPLGEAAPPEEVANLVAFLVSGLARHLTGSTIDINGATHVR